MDVLNAIMNWIVAPVTGFVVYLYTKVQHSETEIAVLKATAAANKEAHDREFKEMKSSFDKVLTKLDNIESHLRK